MLINPKTENEKQLAAALLEKGKEVERLRQEIIELKKCCAQRGARMQIMREWMDQQIGLGGPGEWWYFCEEIPEAADWFDVDGVTVDA